MQWLICLLLLFLTDAEAAPARCSSQHDDCEERVGPGSVCREDGKCTVPELEKGCLQSLLPDWNQKRVCNSEDSLDAAERGLCETPELPYSEIRLYGGNWESRVFQTWLVQIILSELLGVPTTVEGGVPEATLNLYDSSHKLHYGVNGVPDTTGAFNRGNTIKDCTMVSRNPESYEACAHVALEAWNFGAEQVNEPVYKGLFEPPNFMGMLGQEAVFVTKFTLENDTSYASYLGLQGEEQRQKLAETFLRPTTWKDYCDQVSPNNCTIEDGIAKRYPQGEAEYDRMFVEGVFRGHFRATDDNDCNLNNETFKCTGHIADFPCGWTSYIEPQMHYLGIPLQSSGAQPNSKGYSYQQLVDMWDAANATKSNLMMFWWSPEPLYQRFINTDAQMMKVTFPVPTQECLDNRVHGSNTCHDSKEVRLGSPLGICETPFTPLMKLFVSSLHKISINPEDPEAVHSPAYNMLRSFQLSEYQLNEMSTYKEDIPSSRQAVCQWAVDNMDYLQTFVPDSYPRIIAHEGNNLTYATTSIGACVAFFVLLTAWMVHKEKEEEAIKLSQIVFLQLLLAGSLLISLGAIVTGMEPSMFTCTASIWFVNIGYTLELVPLIVKVAAICRIMQAAQRLQRVALEKPKLYGTVAVILFFIIAYLAIWTGLDPPEEQAEYYLTGDERESGETVIGTSHYCSSESDTWEYVAVGWNVVLLFIASVWAFQMRRTHAKLNETATLAFLIYSHFMFVVLRAVTFMLSGSVQESVLMHMRSLIYSFDTCATIIIYFVPKLTASGGITEILHNRSLDLKTQIGKQWSLHPPRLSRVSSKFSSTGSHATSPHTPPGSKEIQDLVMPSPPFSKETKRFVVPTVDAADRIGRDIFVEEETKQEITDDSSSA